MDGGADATASFSEGTLFEGDKFFEKLTAVNFEKADAAWQAHLAHALVCCEAKHRLSDNPS